MEKISPHKDIKSFGNLRKQLAPLLSKQNRELLQRIEGMLGIGSLPVPQQPKKLTHKDRVRRHLFTNRTPVIKSLVTLFILIPLLSSAQFGDPNDNSDEPKLTAAFIGEYSLKALGKYDYMGMSVHAGIWAGSNPNWPNIGAMVGYVEYKVNDTTPARRSAALTLALRVKLINEKLQISPYYSFLLGWQSDAGFRVGWKIQKGTYIGIVISETMHYGIGAMVSIF